MLFVLEDLEDAFVNYSINLIVFFSLHVYAVLFPFTFQASVAPSLLRDLNTEVISVEYIFVWKIVGS